MERFARRLVGFFLCALLLPVSVLAGSENTGDSAIALPATIAFDMRQDDKTIDQTALQPDVAFVLLGDDRSVTGRGAISSSLNDYLSASQVMLPSLFIQSDAAADALAEYLKTSSQDVIVAAEAKHAHLVSKVKKKLPAVRGLIDFSATTHEMTKEELGNVVSTTNAAGAKIALISSVTATREAVRYLQSRLISVWVYTSSDEKEILTHLTNGVNGLVTQDYVSAYNALGHFQADVPIMLRTPIIIGHRGLPSEYIENTLRSVKAAADAGADLLEYDIYLSADGEIFALHDSSMKRLFNRADIENVESMTLAQLQSISFDSNSANGVQNKNNTPAKDSIKGTIEVSADDRIPSLRELFQEFKNTDIVHLVEIKSQNTDIVDKLKSLAKECGVTDQMAVISFNVPILKKMAESWPEMSLGCLGYDDAKGRNQKKGKQLDPSKEMPYENHMKLIEDAGGNPSAAVLALSSATGLYNGTYNPSNANLSYPTIAAGRHRGITAWPWTYNSPDLFAKDYLFGMFGLTTNFTTWISDLPESFTASDADLAVGSKANASLLFAPVIKTYAGAMYTAEVIEPIIITGKELVKLDLGSIIPLSQGACVVMLRARITLEIAGKHYGNFYIYSNPVTLTVKP